MEVIITSEETWVYGYDQKRNAILRSGSSTILQDRRQRVRCVPKWQSRWFYFLTWKGLFTKNMSPKVKQWINITIEVLKRLRMAVCRKRPKKRGISRVGSASRQCTDAHSSIDSFFFKQTMTFLWFSNHYSPVLDTCDFRLFSKLKMTFKGKRLDDINSIKENTTKQLGSIPKNSIKKCFQ